VDPAIAQTHLAYAYANGNPVSNTDLTGASAEVYIFWSTFHVVIFGQSIAIPAGFLDFTVDGSGLIVNDLDADFEIAGIVCNYHIRFAFFRSSGQWYRNITQSVQENCSWIGGFLYPRRYPWYTRYHAHDGFVDAQLFDENSELVFARIHIHP
jgi:hypothetical protein